MEKIPLFEKLRSMNIKKMIKIATLIFGLTLITFISFFDAIFDFVNFDWAGWLADTAVLVGIMIFGILMGESIGTDIQKEKIGGLFQNNCEQYIEAQILIDSIKYYFSQFWLWYKAKKLKEKRIEYLVDNQFDIMVATTLIENIEKEDMVVGKLIYDSNDPTQKIFIKVVKGKEIKFKKLSQEKADILLQTFDFVLDTYGESYYLSLYDDGESKVNEAEKGKAIANKIKRDKRNNFLIKISSSLIVSIVWSALTVREFVSDGGPEAVRKAWLRLVSRLTALITSFVSGYATSVINVKDQARAIENKTNILKEFKYSVDKKEFIPETYEQMLEREFKEQELEKGNLVVEEKPKKVHNNNVPKVTNRNKKQVK